MLNLVYSHYSTFLAKFVLDKINKAGSSLLLIFQTKQKKTPS